MSAPRISKQRLTYFVSTEDQPRAHRAADAVTAAVGFLLMAWGIYGAERVSALEEAIQDQITGQPSWLGSAMELVFAFGLIYGVGLVVAMIVGGRPRRSALRDVSIAIIASALLAVALSIGLEGEWPYVLPELGLDDPSPRFPILRVVLITATLVAASPHLARPMRRLGWLTIVLTAFAAVALGYGGVSDAIGAVGIGMLVSGLVLVVAGSPKGYPDPASVAEALEDMGLAIDDVTIDPQQTWGVRRLVGAAPDGSTLAIKAYGRDASDSMRMAKAWRTLWYRESGRAVSFSRLEAVEHEALVTMMAERAGVRVAEVIAAGQTSSEIALLVQKGGTSLREFDASEITDDAVVRIWEDVADLHDAAISHGSLTTDAILFDGTSHAISDFLLGSVVAGESDRAGDIVELLVSLTLLIGAERAVRTAVQGLGTDAVSESLPYLQLPAVSRDTRKQAENAKATLKELQDTVSEVTGSDLPEPVKLRRVSGRDMGMAVLLLFALGALIPMLAGIDYAEVWSVLQNANWGLMFVALVVGQTMFIPQAMGMMFAVGGNLPFWPLVTLQVAIMFIGLAVPSVAGRVAMNSAFLRKFGVDVASAVTQGAIDSFSGFLVEASILLLAFFSSDLDLGIDVDTEDVSWGVVLLIAVGLAIITVAAVTKVKRLRETVLPVVKTSWQALSDVLKEPGRALGLLGSNLATRLVMAAALWLVLEAIHAPLGFAACLVAVVATNLLQGLVPVPGGIGVSETVMTGFLVVLGVDENAAFAATISWRVITFYLPSAEGYFAMRWLEKHEYL